MNQNLTDIRHQIAANAIAVHDLLLTVRKALEQDGMKIDGFDNHYDDILAQAIDRNWKNRDLADSFFSGDRG